LTRNLRLSIIESIKRERSERVQRNRQNYFDNNADPLVCKTLQTNDTLLPRCSSFFLGLRIIVFKYLNQTNQ